MNTNDPAHVPTGQWKADDDASAGGKDRLCSDRDLLFGRMAVLNGFVDDKTVEAAGRQMDSSKLLAEVLVETGAITEETRQTIQELLELHISIHGDDPQQSLASLSASTMRFSDPSGAETFPFAPTAKGDNPRPLSFGDYEIIALIAEGGMGVVYKARQTKLNRIVALKMIRSGELANDEQIERFYSEAQAAAKLDHPGIVPIHEVGEQNGQHFFSMAFVEGMSLYEKVKNDGPLPSRQAAEVLMTVAEALQFGHDKGIVHRDIKPQNILLDESESPRVTDFGLAKHGDSEMTVAGQIMGTPSYMPPEQAEGNQADIGPVSDVYSLGATLYYVLTGRPPFQASSPTDTLRQVIDAEPVPPRRLNPDIPRDLETICLKCLRKERAGRYATAEDMAGDLHRWLDNKPIVARPLGPLGKSVRWVQRRPAVAALLALVCCVAVAGFIGIDWQRRRAVANYEQSEKLRTEVDRQRLRAVANYEQSEELRTEVQKNFRESERQRARRETNFERAVEAVDRMLTRVGEQRLLNTPEMSETRKALLQDAVAFYSRLISEETDDPDLLAETARAHIRVGKIQALLEELDAAAKSYTESLRLLEVLVEKHPSRTKYRRALADAYAKLAEVFVSRGDFKSAEAELKRALVHNRRLVSDNPRQERFRLDVATRLASLAAVFAATRRRTEAEKLYGEVREIYGGLSEETMRDAKARRDHGHVQYRLAYVYEQTGRLKEAAECYRRAIELYNQVVEAGRQNQHYRDELLNIKRGFAVLMMRLRESDAAEALFKELNESRQKLADEFPRIAAYRDALGQSHGDLGILHARSGRLQKALGFFSAGIKVSEALAADFPQVVRYRRVLGYRYNNLGTLNSQMGDKPEATRCYRQALALRRKLVAESPETQDYRAELAVSTLDLGGYLEREKGYEEEAGRLLQEAVDLGKQLVKESPDVTLYRHKLAIAHRALAGFQTGRDDQQAEKQLNESLTILGRLATELPSNPKYDRQRAFAYDQLGELQLDSVRDADAVASFRTTEKILGALSTKFKRRFEIRQDHVKSTRKLARALAAIGKHEEAETMFRKSLDMWKVLIDEIPNNPQSLREQAKSRNWLAWFLVTCPEIERRDASQAVRFAEQVVKQESDEHDYWNTLALAHYRARDWKKAKTAVDRALKEAGNELSEMNWLIQAMILKQQNAAAQAKTAYDKALAQRAQKSKEKKRIGRIEAESLSTVRREAAALFSRRG